MIVLADNMHQYHVDIIEEFICRMCMPYRKLNSITKPFALPNPRRDHTISIIGGGSNKIWIIIFDAC